MTDFWQNHGIFFLIFITLFPRLTLLFSSVAFGGLFWWIGFIFAPRLLVAVLATMSYLQTNPILVVISWIVAFSGEFKEKSTLRNRVRIIRVNNYGPPPRGNAGGDRTIPDSNTIDADYTRVE